jgi:hypothetical protein
LACFCRTLTKDEFGGVNQSANKSTEAKYKFYGQTDYIPIAYVDLTETGRRGAFSRGAYREAMLNLLQTSSSATVGDGTSNTLMFVEDAGRTLQTKGTHCSWAGPNSYTGDKPNYVTCWVGNAGAPVVYRPTDAGWGSAMSNSFLAGLYPGTGNFWGSGVDWREQSTVPNRWADPDSGGGLSGPPNEENFVTSARKESLINNNKTLRPSKQSRFGGSTTGGDFDAATSYRDVGPGDCSWHLNNCGPNDEPFSMHAGDGVFAGFGDCSVKWLSSKIGVDVMRQLADPNDSELLPAKF